MIYKGNYFFDNSDDDNMFNNSESDLKMFIKKTTCIKDSTKDVYLNNLNKIYTDDFKRLLKFDFVSRSEYVIKLILRFKYANIYTSIGDVLFEKMNKKQLVMIDKYPGMFVGKPRDSNFFLAGDVNHLIDESVIFKEKLKSLYKENIHLINTEDFMNIKDENEKEIYLIELIKKFGKKGIKTPYPSLLVSRMSTIQLQILDKFSKEHDSFLSLKFIEPTPDPATHDPATHDPATHDPATHDPATHDPATHDPATPDPPTPLENDVKTYIEKTPLLRNAAKDFLKKNINKIDTNDFQDIDPNDINVRNNYIFVILYRFYLNNMKIMYRDLLLTKFEPEQIVTIENLTIENEDFFANEYMEPEKFRNYCCKFLKIIGIHIGKHLFDMVYLFFSVWRLCILNWSDCLSYAILSSITCGLFVLYHVVVIVDIMKNYKKYPKKESITKILMHNLGMLRYAFIILEFYNKIFGSSNC